jgi:hypothetical protein
MVTSPEISRQVALDRIRVPEDVRMLDDAPRAGARRLQAAAHHRSARLRAHGDGFDLFAGFHRDPRRNR